MFDKDNTVKSIYDCVDSFSALLNIEYHFILGRKGKKVSLKVEFDKKDCIHLIGLQHLKDRPDLKKDRGKLFDEIKNHKISLRHFESSDHYNKIADRVRFLPSLEHLFDSNDTVFRYNQKANAFSMIEADYLMKNKAENRNVFIFLSLKHGDTYFCRSFFPENKMDYTKGQASWTLLFKKKVDKLTETEEILYNRFRNE